MLTQRKLDQKNHDNEVLQDNLKEAMQRKPHPPLVDHTPAPPPPTPAGLEERSGAGEEQQERINSLEKDLRFMEVKKNEAINKLAQVRPHPLF